MRESWDLSDKFTSHHLKTAFYDYLTTKGKENAEREYKERVMKEKGFKTEKEMNDYYRKKSEDFFNNGG